MPRGVYTGWRFVVSYEVCSSSVKRILLPQWTAENYHHHWLTAMCTSDLLTGRGRPFQTVSYYAYPYKGTEAILEGASVLTVSPSCTLAWLPYVVGSSLPENIVKCGNVSGVPALCARHWRFTASRMFLGYYPIGDDGAYYAYWGVQRPTEFDIFIEVYNFPLPSFMDPLLTSHNRD